MLHNVSENAVGCPANGTSRLTLSHFLKHFFANDLEVLAKRETKEFGGIFGVLVKR